MGPCMTAWAAGSAMSSWSKRFKYVNQAWQSRSVFSTQLGGPCCLCCLPFFQLTQIRLLKHGMLKPQLSCAGIKLWDAIWIASGISVFLRCDLHGILIYLIWKRKNVDEWRLNPTTLDPKCQAVQCVQCKSDSLPFSCNISHMFGVVHSLSHFLALRLHGFELWESSRG